ncbi:histidine kinase/DNA gyrase B/HSP90-like ATPase [Breoghania corrubedonensis]|uniref:histidine kinase n=1 Tax=Breoghania corrubedonensis TaxID=665038 RepID=A0A2T5UVZ6_9HYPH|nr:HAMP domain-containing sensor histidine kinase [Breoghania corrubedonensis]PTW55680.1 histidine kinase/DNA gyrase B/HSP90-like ATPase [Breoghania corrubedonensis]
MSTEDFSIGRKPAQVRLWHYGMPLAIVVTCIGLLALALVQLTDIARTMRVDAPSNMLWVISQAEVEALRTQNALTTARLAGWDAASREALGVRYDLLMSRLDLLSNGPQLRSLAELGIADTIVSYQDKAKSFDPRLKPLAEERAPQFADLLSGLRGELNRSANRQMVAGWENLSSQFDRYRETVSQVIASVIGVLLGAMLLGWQIVSGKQSLLRAEEARLRTIRLEHELKGVRATARYYRDFASVVSHQFRTRLAIIDSAAQRLIIGGKLPNLPALEERRSLIRQTVTRLTGLVDAALMAGRLDHGAVNLHATVCDLSELALDIRDEFQRGVPERTIAFDKPDGPLPVCCDPSLVSHIIMNLIDNALKYSPPDRPISVRFETADDRCGCTISDFGSGISDADLPHIFDRFRRGQDRKDAQGAGIGLWIARQLAELQGGTVTVSNKAGGGAAFTIWLPASARGEAGIEDTARPEGMRP